MVACRFVLSIPGEYVLLLAPRAAWTHTWWLRAWNKWEILGAWEPFWPGFFPEVVITNSCCFQSVRKKQGTYGRIGKAHSKLLKSSCTL